MSNPQPPSARPDKPTAKQLRYLRTLAAERGQSFTNPTTKAQASAEIRRLKTQPRQSRLERHVERRELEQIATPRDATRVDESEIAGYGAHARWTHSGDRS
jgi:hypothetical protein